MSVFSKIKSWITGGGSSSGSRSSSSGGRPAHSDSRASAGRRASRVSNYGGGGSRSYRDYSSGGYRSDYEERRAREKRQRDEQKKRRDATTNALASISKRTDSLSSGRSATTAGGATSTGNGQARVIAKLGEMSRSAPVEPKVKAAQDSRERARQTLERISNDRKSYNKATGNKYNTEVGTKQERARARQRIKMGEYQGDPNAEKWEVKHHPIAASAARGALSGVTFGGSEVLAQTSKKRKESGAEEYYQKHKNRKAEVAGEIAGSLAGFGLTGEASARAVGKLAPKALKSGSQKAATKLATKKLIQRTAEKEAVKRFGVEGATKEVIEQIAKRRANQVMAELGKDAAINVTTGLASDLSHSYLDATENGKFDPEKFGRSMAENAAMNTVLGGATSLFPAFRVGKQFADDAIESAVRNADEAAEIAGDNFRVSLNRPRRTDVRMPEVRPQAVGEITEQAVKNVEPPRAKEVTNLVPGAENARTGERTEFRRGNEETAREQARARRTTNNRQGATQESFDREYTAFAQKANENAARAEDLKSRIRAAGSEEEKTTLKKQLDDLNAEMRREYNKASMRYHPDRGGSNEWMGKFNNAYDDYKRGSYKRGASFRSAESSTRARTASAGGNGNTPPPRRGFAEAGERGFRRPQGKATNKKPRVMNSVEDIVYKRSERKSAREKINDAAKSLRTQVFDSLSAFEDVERSAAKAAKRDVDYGAIDQVRRHQTIANRSIGNHQVKWNGDRFENGKSLKDIYKGMDEDTERAFDSYLLLKHAPDRLREGKPIFDNTILKDGSDLNDPKVLEKEAQKILEKHPEFAQKAEEIYQYTRNELQNRVDSGLLKQSVVDDWNKKYPYYVPTGRDGFNELHGISGSTVGAEDVKAAKGSDLDIRSIRDQLANATTRNWRDMTTNEMFKRTFGDRIATELAKQPDGGMGMVLDNTINLAKAHEGGKYYADIFIDGRKHKVEIEDRFYEGLKDLYKNGRIGNALIDTTNDAFSKVATTWKSLITEWSPIFMVKNFMRDFPEAIINSRQTKEFLGSMGDAWTDLINGGEYSTALRDAGISQSTFIDLDKALTRDVKDGKGVFSKFAKANELTEMYPRLVEYMATFKKAGVDLKDADIALRNRAAANAADVTVNFGRSGSVGKMLNRGFVPFFNPSAQGWSKFVRNVTEQKGAKEMLGFLARATALGAAPLAISNYLYQDNPNYQMISARDKANNYIIAIPPYSDDTNMFIKIPRSRFASVYGLPVVNAFNDNKMGWAEAIKVANDQVAPIDPLESTLLSPFIAAKNNKSWYGSAIVPKSLEDLPKSEQYDANTSAIGKALGKATENLPKEFQISPKKADYIIDAETGVIGDFALPMLTPSRQHGTGFVGKVAAPAGNVIKRQFTIDSTTQNDLSSRFYEKLQDANTNSKSIKGGEEEQAEYKRMNAYSTEASKLTKAITELQNSDKSTKQDDIYGLQKVRNQLMQDALDGKAPPSSAKALDAVQKYVGTSYAIENFGSSADKEAMKVYGASVYGNISDEEMAKRIDGDKNFYKGVRAVGELEDKLAKNGTKGSTALSRAVALASVDASDEMFGAYQGTKKSRTETANKMDRARTYLADGGSVDEFVKLEKTRKTLGKLSDYDKDAELESVLKQLKNNEISEAEYYQKQGEIKYNANISYVGLATSLAQANAPARGYTLYDIKAKNVQKGINLAAMGFTARDYREMAKAVDADGNGYPKKQEIIDYVANSDVKDKATLYDALYYYKSSRNPFGTPTRYSREVAAATGKKNGIEAISSETGELKLKPDEESSSRGYGYRRRRRGYRRRGYRRYSGSTKQAEVKMPKPKTLKASSFTKSVALGQKSSSSSGKVEPPMLKRVEAKIDLPNKKR